MEKYSYSTDIFSPEGRLYQVEYAMEAVKNSSTVIGLKTKAGVLLSSENRLYSPLLVRDSLRTLCLSPLSDYAGILSTGILADASFLVSKLQEYSCQFMFNYKKEVSAVALANHLSKHYLSLNTELNNRLSNRKPEDNLAGRAPEKKKKAAGKGFARPFGVGIALASCNEKNGETELVEIDSSGKWSKTNAVIFGSAETIARKILVESLVTQDGDLKEVSFEEGLEILARIYNNVMENKISEFTVEIALVGPESGFEIISDQTKRILIEKLLSNSKEKELHDAKEK